MINRLYRRTGLRLRITGAVILGVIALLVVFAFLADRAATRSQDVALEERMRLAETISRRTEESTLRLAQEFESAARQLPLETDDLEMQLLEAARGEVDLPSTVVRMDSAGQVQWVLPASEDPSEVSFAADPRVMDAGGGIGGAILQLSSPGDSDGMPVVLVTPLADEAGERAGFVAVELYLFRDGQNLAPLGEISGGVHAEVVDGQGYVVAHSETDEKIEPAEHVEVLRDYLANGQPGTAFHDVSSGRDHVVAFYPFSSFGGGIVVEQEKDSALAVPRELRETILVVGAVAVVIGSSAAWLHARTVVKPIEELTQASERIAGGDLEEPFASKRGDEIGILARSFEGMRQRLRESMAEKQLLAEELEDRVVERTKQLESANLARVELLARLISAQEDERSRIARELHDESAQDLASMLAGWQGIQDSLPDSAVESKRMLGEMRSRTISALGNLRRAILDLRPAVLDELGLAAAVRWYARTRLESKVDSVSVDVIGEQRNGERRIDTAVFRIAQEALNNVAKHADAESVTVNLAFDESAVSLTVQDDGIGFDVSAAMQRDARSSHVGLAGMVERAALVGGNVEVRSSPGEGTRLVASIPTNGEGRMNGS